MADLKPHLCPESEQELIEESVADVVMYDPRCELLPQVDSYKIIDGSVAFMRDAPLGMRMYPETYVRRVLESRDNLARELAPRINGRTFMGEPVLPERAISHPAPVQAEQSLEVVAWRVFHGPRTGYALFNHQPRSDDIPPNAEAEPLTDLAKAATLLSQKDAEIADLEIACEQSVRLQWEQLSLIQTLRAQLAAAKNEIADHEAVRDELFKVFPDCPVYGDLPGYAAQMVSKLAEAKSLLDEVRGNFTRDDDLPDDLLPRIDRLCDGT